MSVPRAAPSILMEGIHDVCTSTVSALFLTAFARKDPNGTWVKTHEWKHRCLQVESQLLTSTLLIGIGRKWVLDTVSGTCTTVGLKLYCLM